MAVAGIAAPKRFAVSATGSFPSRRSSLAEENPGEVLSWKTAPSSRTRVSSDGSPPAGSCIAKSRTPTPG